MIHVRLATPMYQGECSGYFTESILKLSNACSQYGITLSWQFLFSESIIARGRNLLAHNALDGEVTHLLFIDADMKFRAEDILAMIQADVGVIAAVCPKKQINWEGVRQAANAGESNLERRTGSWNFVPLVENTNIEVKQNEPLEVARAGTGIMLIKMSVFEDLKPKVKTFLNDNREPMSEFFKMDINEEGIFIGEDYYFCNLYKANGGKIFVAPWTEVGHHGSMLYQGTLF